MATKCGGILFAWAWLIYSQPGGQLRAALVHARMLISL